MVREALVLVDLGTGGSGGDTGGSDLVVDAPAHVLGPGLAAVAPPGVLLGAGVQLAEDVNEADVIQEAAEPLALFGQEAGVLLVGAPVLQVDFLVGDVPVAAQDDLAAAVLQFLHVAGEGFHEDELALQALFGRGAGGDVDRDDGVGAEIHLDVAALGVEFGLAEAFADGLGGMGGVDAHAAVAAPLGQVEASDGRADGLHGVVHVGELGAHFLHADGVGPKGGRPGEPALAGGGPDTVKILGYDSQHAGTYDERSFPRVYPVRARHRSAALR